MKKYTLLLFTPLLSVAQAVEHASAVVIRAQPLGTSALGEMALSLFGLTVVMGGIYWFTKRYLTRRLGVGGRRQSMQVISVTMLGPKEKIVVLDTRQGEALVLGVTAQNIRLLDKRPLDKELP